MRVTMSETPTKPDDETPPANTSPRAFSIELGAGVDEALRNARERASTFLKKGKHTKVRLKFRGRELATMPLSVFVAAEAAGFLLAGPARLLAMLAANAVGKVLLDVEFINEADGVVAAGKARLLDGELDEAIARFREAIEMDAEHAGAWLNLGIGAKLKGERSDAMTAFEKAAALDSTGDAGREARRQIDLLKSRGP